ncbi:uncharacterized protein KY384_002002 [Bacidia gigantensis]|uniref:uncharacterized protein n=1 Tax=Bacidia gigantensis TaxID=2732470 RepID=UPI001D042A66|nr:uncharacterized protein KY384_002002 [Bacidia gigantensis]KAG8533219.1 hypothetical protein KY384_002002 [Bacidia gigantensis]
MSPKIESEKLEETAAVRSEAQHLGKELGKDAANSTSPAVSSKSSENGESRDTEKATGTRGAEKPPRDIHGIKWGLAVFSVLASTFLFALDNTIVADVQPAIVESFGDVSKLPWLSVAFLVAAAGTNLVWGKMYAQFDAKILYLITVFLFEAGSAICGAANLMDVLIFGRALCGFGGVGMYAGVMTLLSVTTTEHERPMYIGLTGVTWGLGTVLGPIIGGAFTDSSAGWRWAFYLNLVIGAIFAPVWLFLLPRFDPRPGVPLRERYRNIDYTGTILICGAYVSGIFAIDFGGNLYAWNSGRIIALFVISGILFIAFGSQQGLKILTDKENRIFPVEFLRSRTMLILFAATASASTATFIPIYFVPLFFQFARNASALSAGVHLLPFVVFLVFFCVANGGIMSANGYYMPWFLVGAVLTVIGDACLYTINEGSSTGKLYGYTILAGAGAGSFVQAGFSVAQASVDPKLIPVAIGFITCAQVGGATISLAIANSIFLNGSVKDITKLLPDESVKKVQGAVAGASSALFEQLDPDLRHQVIVAIVDNMKKVYILGITAGALVVILSVLMKREKLFMKPAAA